METRPAYLYAAISGTVRGDNVTSLAKEMIRELRRVEPPMLLLDVRSLRMQLNPFTAVSLVSAFPRLAGELRIPTAIVYGALGQSIVRFFETVLLNRGYPIWIFPDTGGAEACLTSIQKTRDAQASRVSLQ
jgi:hypothetical protein